MWDPLTIHVEDLTGILNLVVELLKYISHTHTLIYIILFMVTSSFSHLIKNMSTN